jgi:hypothetical protein
MCFAVPSYPYERILRLAQGSLRDARALPSGEQPRTAEVKVMKPIFVLAFAAVLAAIALPADAASRKQSRAQQPQGQIACTTAGCLRVPPGCRPAPGRTWNGDPSGFDVMVCGGGRRGGYSMYGTPY